MRLGKSIILVSFCELLILFSQNSNKNIVIFLSLFSGVLWVEFVNLSFAGICQKLENNLSKYST